MVGKGKRKSSSEDSLGPDLKKTKQKKDCQGGVDGLIRNLRRASSTRDDYSVPGRVCQELVGMPLTPDVITKLLQLTVDSEIKKSKLDQSPEKTNGLQWDRLPVHSLVRQIIRVFFKRDDYQDAHHWLTVKTKASPFFEVLRDLFVSEELEPSYDSFKNDSEFAQFVVGPFVERVKRTRNTFTGDLMSFLMCKIYEYKEKSSDFSVFHVKIHENLKYFLDQLAEKLPVLLEQLQIPLELQGNAAPLPKPVDLQQSTEEDDGNEQELAEKNFRACRATVSSTAKTVEQKIKEAEKFLDKFQRSKEEHERLARINDGTVALISKYIADIKAEEELRLQFEAMKQEVDETEDVLRMETRMNFYTQVVEVIIGSLSREQQEQILNGKQEIPWEEFDISFEN